MNDAEVFDYYKDPAKREPAAGEPHRRPDRPLTCHLPVRFPRATIEEVERLAKVDGTTVSTWIRRTVEEAVRRRDAFGPASR